MLQIHLFFGGFVLPFWLSLAVFLRPYLCWIYPYDMIGWRCFCWYKTSTEFRRLDANEDYGIGQCPMTTANLPNISGKPFCRAELVGNFGKGRVLHLIWLLSGQFSCYDLSLVSLILFYCAVDSHTSLRLHWVFTLLYENMFDEKAPWQLLSNSLHQCLGETLFRSRNKILGRVWGWQ